MSLVSMVEMLAQAKRGEYAVGYFESWNLESLKAVMDAAEEARRGRWQFDYTSEDATPSSRPTSSSPATTAT